MPIDTNDGYQVQGGIAIPVYLVNRQVSTTGGGSGGSDATAANQVAGNTSLATISGQTAPPTALTSGSEAVTTSAAAFNGGTSLACRGLLVTNDDDSVGNVLIGNSAAQSYLLKPGETVAIEIDNVNKVWRRTASGAATVYWMRVG